MVCILEADGTLWYANRQWRSYTAADSGEDPVPHAACLASTGASKTIAGLFTAINTSNYSVPFELPVRRFDGVSHLHEVRIVPMNGIADGAIRWTCIFAKIDRATDTTTLDADLPDRISLGAERERATAGAEENDRIMAVAEEIAHFGHWRFDLGTQNLYWSAGMYRTYGLPTTFKPTFENSLTACHPDDRDRVSASATRALGEKTAFRSEWRVLRPDGTIRHVLSYGRPEYAENGAAIAFIGVIQDITESKEAESERERLNLRMQIATQAAQVGIWDWDIATNKIVWNPIMFSLYGFPDAAFLPTYDKWAASIHPDDRARAEREIALAVAGGPAFDTEFRVMWPNGEAHNTRAMATLLSDGAGPARMIGTNWDITELRRLAEELQNEKNSALLAAAHDALTGLLNRRGLEAWVESQPGGLVATLLYLDIDGFKAVNDRGGHAAGDETLRRVAHDIQAAVRGQDQCARFGGDEFIVLLPNVLDARAVDKVCARIGAAVKDSCPLGLDNATRIDISVGVSHLSAANSLSDALIEADAHLYRCKREHKAVAGSSSFAAGRNGST